MHQFWSTDPWIVYQNTDRLNNTDLLPDAPCIRIIRHSRATSAVEIFNTVKVCRQQRPQDIVLYAAQCEEHYRLRVMGMPCIWWNHNALIDETKFVLDPKPTIGHLSISRVIRFKRLELLRRIPMLKIAGSVEDKEYLAELKAVMHPTTLFLNEQHLFLEEHQIAKLLNASKYMLIPSDGRVEGNCRAITESLLCGCPVIVSSPQPMCATWLRGDTSLHVAPNPEAIQHVVQQPRKWNKELLRKITLDEMYRYRERLAEDVQRAAVTLGYPNFTLDVKSLIDGQCVAWLEWERWLKRAPEAIRQKLMSTERRGDAD